MIMKKPLNFLMTIGQISLKCKGENIMKIRTLNDFKNLKEGAWLEDSSGISEVVTAYGERNSCIGLAEVIFEGDEGDEYTLGTENPNVTFLDIKGADIIS